MVLAYLAGPRRPFDRVLLALVLALTSMSPRFPRSRVVAFFEPYAVKAIPCVLVWARTVWRLAAGPAAPAGARPGTVPWIHGESRAKPA